MSRFHYNIVSSMSVGLFPGEVFRLLVQCQHLAAYIPALYRVCLLCDIYWSTLTHCSADSDWLFLKTHCKTLCTIIAFWSSQFRLYAVDRINNIASRANHCNGYCSNMTWTCNIYQVLDVWGVVVIFKCTGFTVVIRMDNGSLYLQAFVLIVHILHLRAAVWRQLANYSQDRVSCSAKKFQYLQ